MRVGLVAYNWEVDSSLALWNLELYARQIPAIGSTVSFSKLCAATPKSVGEEEDKLLEVLNWIRTNNFDLLGFSCYVWNMRFVNRIAKAVKVLLPHIKIVYGGQQIRGFYIPLLLQQERCVDICVEGEAEITFQRLLLHFLTGEPKLSSIPGISYCQEDGSIHTTGPAETIQLLGDIPSPYLGGEDLPFGGAYLYEASRGCPYRCSFCIWGESKGVREYEMDRVRRELDHILNQQPSHMMFCDGTFNMRKERAKEILSIFVDRLKRGDNKPFSMLLEQKLELIDEELAKILDDLVRFNPLVTLEFGLQSSSKTAAQLMRRPFSEKNFRDAWNRLTPKLKSMAILDCIYGLPGDGVKEFKETVDFAFSLGPHRIQCFRLSVLPGSEFERQADEFKLKYSKDPDHMVWETDWLTFDEMMWLEVFGFAVADLYHFHGSSIKSLLGLNSDYYSSFSALISDFVEQNGRTSILRRLYAGIRPEGRWRAIDLSAPFTKFVVEYALKKLGANEESIVCRFTELLRYERALGKMAVSGLDAEEANGIPHEEPTAAMLRSAADILTMKYDIPEFITRIRGSQFADIRDLREKPSYVAVSMRGGHHDVKFPVSYRIGRRHVAVLEQFSHARLACDAVSNLTAEDGSRAQLWEDAVRLLRDHELLLPASVNDSCPSY